MGVILHAEPMRYNATMILLWRLLLVFALLIPCVNASSFSALEAASNGRLGIAAINTANNERIEYRANERFPFCSTGKLMVVAAILAKSMKHLELLNENIHYTQQHIDSSGYYPITEKHLSTGMTVASLCEAAMDYSDNTAMNLLINVLGGTKAINAYAHSIGDKTFRLDRDEPELNTAIPGDVRDTTTPAAMERSLQTLTLGNTLAPAQRKQLFTWLKDNTTGGTRIRAGVPNGWIVGDKTGGGAYGTNNDIAILFPPHCAPIVMVIYFTQNKENAPRNDAVIVSTTKLVINQFAKNDKCLGAS